VADRIIQRIVYFAAKVMDILFKGLSDAEAFLLKSLIKTKTTHAFN